MEELKFGPRALTQSAYLKWQRFYNAEPWGSFRDNLHAALIAREVRLGRLKPGTRVNLNDFMLLDPARRRRENRASFLTLLRLVAVPKSKARAKKGRRAR